VHEENPTSKQIHGCTIITLCKKAAPANAQGSGSRTTFFIASAHQPAIKKTILHRCHYQSSVFVFNFVFEFFLCLLSVMFWAFILYTLW
jgi:hypothetical protein